MTAFAIAAAVLILVYALGAPIWRALRYERVAIAGGEWWRLLSGHLVHEDLGHLAMNLAGLVAIGALYAADARVRDWALIALASALGVGVGLYVGEPALLWYIGASGVLHGLWAAGAVAAWRRWHVESLASLALLAAKLAFEYWHGALTLELGAGLPVITAAHRYGALAGLVAALALRLWRAPL